MTGNVYPASFISNERMRAAQAEFNRMYNEMADNITFAPAFTYSWYQLPWYSRAWYNAKRPWWALQAWVCHHICSCD